MKKTIPVLRFPDFHEAWTQRHFESVFQCFTNNSLSRADLCDEPSGVQNVHYGDIHTKLPQILDLSKATLPFVRPEKIKNTARQPHLSVGDILFADASEDLKDVGKVIEITGLGKYPTVSGLHTIHARPSYGYSFSNGFCGYLFASPTMREQIQNESQGAKVLAISKARLAKIEVFFPCKEEQIKISATLSAVDEKTGSLKKHEEALRRFKGSLMQKLFSQEIRFQQDDGEDFPDWEEATLPEVAQIRKGKQLSKADMKGGIYPVMNGSLSPVGWHNEANREAGGIAMTQGGKCGQVRFMDTPYWSGGDSFEIRPQSAHPAYLFYWLQMNQKYFENLSTGGALKHLSKDVVTEFVVPVPSVEEQAKIGNALSAMDAKIAAVGQEIILMETFKKGLLQQMFV